MESGHGREAKNHLIHWTFGVLAAYIILTVNTRLLAAFVLAVVVTSGANAADVMRGDIVRNAAPPAVMCPTPPRTAVLSSDLKFKSWLYTGDAVAFDSIGILYAAGDMRLESFDSSLQRIRSVALPEPASALAVDAAGFSYVVGQSGRAYVYSPGGAGQRSFVLPNLSAPVGAISVDVAPNGCTLLYVGDHGSVNRFDVCAQLALAPIATGERFEAVRALSDGGFVGATAGHIKFYDANGRLLHDILAPPGSPIVSLSFDTDPLSLWIANGQFLTRVGIVLGTIAARTPITDPGGVAVFGERRISSASLAAAIGTRRRGASH